MRSFAGLVTATVLIGASVAMAVPAHAASFGRAVVCQFSGEAAITGGASSITGAIANDTVEINGISGINTLNVTLSGVTGVSTITSGSSFPVQYTITSASPAYMTFTVASSSGGTCDGRSVTLSINGGTPGGSSSAGASSGPAPLVQQFGRPASGTCETVASSDLNWGGVPSGGWSESWAQWMNDGIGGAVCTRTLVYSDNLGAWTIG